MRVSSSSKPGSKLSGDDNISQKSRMAIDILVEAVATAEHSKPYRPAEIIDFGQAARSKRR
jgi:hypothetical protein